MRKVLFVILSVMLMQTMAYANAEISDANITYSPEYYRQQVVIVQKYTESNFMTAVIDGNSKLVDLYLKSGMDPNTTQMKLPAVFAAIGAKKHESLDLLLKSGANPEIEKFGITPLIFAISQNDKPSVDLLIKYKSNVNRSNKGLSPLYTAVKKQHYTIAESLVEAGAFVDDETIIQSIRSKNSNVKNLVLKTAVKQLK